MKYAVLASVFIRETDELNTYLVSIFNTKKEAQKALIESRHFTERRYPINWDDAQIIDTEDVYQIKEPGVIIKFEIR